MMKTKIILVLLMLSCLPMDAQKKLFTLEDLNFGGTNFRRFQPENRWYTWWGDQLMYLDAEEGGTVDRNGQQRSLFSLNDIGNDCHSAYDASYPYPHETVVLLKNSKERILYDWKKKKWYGHKAVRGRVSLTGTRHQGLSPMSRITNFISVTHKTRCIS